MDTDKRETSRKRYPTAAVDPLAHLPGRYWADGDLHAFMEEAFPFLQRYARRRFRGDEEEEFSNFLVEHYDRVPRTLHLYRECQHIPFSHFLAKQMRLYFKNYRRRQARQNAPSYATDRIELAAAPEEDGRGFRDQLKDRVSGAVDELPVGLRTPLKLRFGLALASEDLRLLARVAGGPETACGVVASYYKRRDSRLNLERRAEDRIRLLSARLSRLEDDSSGAHAQLQRWKARLEAWLERTRFVYSHRELARIFGVAPSTIQRRLERATRMVLAATRDAASPDPADSPIPADSVQPAESVEGRPRGQASLLRGPRKGPGCESSGEDGFVAGRAGA